jgi:hypothetical protein
MFELNKKYIYTKGTFLRDEVLFCYNITRDYYFLKSLKSDLVYKFHTTSDYIIIKNFVESSLVLEALI